MIAPFGKFGSLSYDELPVAIFRYDDDRMAIFT